MHYPQQFQKAADEITRYKQLMTRYNVLDFNTSGQAIIDMPFHRDISFLENFGFSPIETIEQEVSQADSPERAAFLQHYIAAFHKTFNSFPNSYIKETGDDDVPELEALDEQSVCFRKIRLLHTTAWYMMGHVPAEIQAVERHLEELEGQHVATENLEEVIRLIRTSKTSNEVIFRLQKKLEIGYIKAKYILNLPLTKLTSSSFIGIAIEKEDYQKRLEFLRKLL